ncbi:MAG: hypothetical protein AAGE61_00885 [Pseudomonadota bacterium]
MSDHKHAEQSAGNISAYEQGLEISRLIEISRRGELVDAQDLVEAALLLAKSDVKTDEDLLALISAIWQVSTSLEDVKEELGTEDAMQATLYIVAYSRRIMTALEERTGLSGEIFLGTKHRVN